MERHILHEIILGRLDNLQRAALKLIIEGHGRGLPADNRDLLGFLGLIPVDVLLRYRIGARHKLDVHRTVRLCLHCLVHTVPGNMEADAGYLPILRCLLDMSGSISLCVKLHIKHYRVIRAAQHGLETDAPPDQHVIANTRNIFLHRKRNRVGKHTAAGKGIFVPAAAHTDAAAPGELQIRSGIVGIRQSKGILFCFRIVF